MKETPIPSQPQNEPVIPPIHSPSFPKSRLIVVGSIAAVIILLILIIGSQKGNINTGFLHFGPTPTPIAINTSPTPIEKTAILSLKQISPTQIAVMADTGKKPLSAVQFELSFDPQVVKNVTVAPSTFFTNPVELIKQIDTTNGDIFYALAIGPIDTDKSGTGTVATISFTLNSGITNQTTFSFLSNTKVTSEGIDESVLKDAKEITIPVQ